MLLGTLDAGGPETTPPKLPWTSVKEKSFAHRLAEFDSKPYLQIRRAMNRRNARLRRLQL